MIDHNGLFAGPPTPQLAENEEFDVMDEAGAVGGYLHVAEVPPRAAAEEDDDDLDDLDDEDEEVEDDDDDEDEDDEDEERTAWQENSPLR